MSVQADQGVVPAGANIAIAKLQSGTAYDQAANALKDKSSGFLLLDISMTDKNGGTIQPNVR